MCLVATIMPVSAHIIYYTVCFMCLCLCVCRVTDHQTNGEYDQPPSEHQNEVSAVYTYMCMNSSTLAMVRYTVLTVQVHRPRFNAIGSCYIVFTFPCMHVNDPNQNPI